MTWAASCVPEVVWLELHPSSAASTSGTVNSTVVSETTCVSDRFMPTSG
jgi:hypothetical protein